MYWENIYSNPSRKFPEYDGWLDKYIDILNPAKVILDLGCGNGVDTVFLASKGINTIACDFSENALKQLKTIISNANIFQLDLTEPLPFEDNYADIVIMDLSLHYFSLSDTRSIVNEVFRVLKKDGFLFCRVNSIHEYIEKKDDIKLEENYYLTSNNKKRFFTVNSLRSLFSEYNIIYCEEYTSKKYHEKKYLIEIEVKK